MKTFIALVAVSLFVGAFAANLTAEQKAKALEIAQECAKKHTIAIEDFMKLREGDFANHNSAKHQCFVQCFLETAGFLKNGELQENVVNEKLGASVDKDKVHSVATACKNIKGANDCETAFKVFECAHQNGGSL